MGSYGKKVINLLKIYIHSKFQLNFIVYFYSKNLLKYEKITVKLTVYNNIMTQEWPLPLFYLCLYN